MKRQTREERRAEEKRIIAEMDEAMGKTPSVESEKTQNQGGKYGATSEVIHCKRCKSVMENGVCPTCGFRIYMPMDEAKRKKIRIIVGAVCVAVFVVAFVVLKVL